MIAKLKKLLIIGFSLGILGAPMAAPVAVFAQSDTIGPVSCGTSFNATNPGQACPTDTSASGQHVSDLIKLVINIFSIIIGVVAVIMIMVGGLKYITSGGDSGNISGAKNTILYAIIGLIVVALAQFMVHFVLKSVGSTVGQG